MKAYSTTTKNEAKLLFIEKEMNLKAISNYFGGKPSVQALSNWAHKEDKHGKTWYDYRRERSEQHYLKLSPQNMANKCFNKIYSLLNNPDVDVAKLPDALHKALLAIERLTGPELQLPVMYHMLQDFVLFSKKDFPDIVNETFLEAIRAYKNHIRARLINDYS